MTAETETGHPGINSWWNMCMKNKTIIIIIIINYGTTAHIWALSSSVMRFLEHTQIRHTVGLLWICDQPVAEASTYTGQLYI
jgi:hypothetical protein